MFLFCSSLITRCDKKSAILPIKFGSVNQILSDNQLLSVHTQNTDSSTLMLLGNNDILTNARGKIFELEPLPWITEERGVLNCQLLTS